MFKIEKDCLDLNTFMKMLHMEMFYIMLMHTFSYEMVWNNLTKRQMKGDCEMTMFKDTISKSILSKS